MSDGLGKHRVYVELSVEIDIFDNWEPGDVSYLLAKVLENWWQYAKSTDETMVVWMRDGFVMKEVKSGY